MTRKNKKRNTKRPQRNQGLDVIRITGKRIADTVLAGGAGQFNLTPTAFSSIAAMSEAFELFRVTRLRYRIHRTTTWVSSTLQTAVYLPGVTDNPPASVLAASASPHCASIAFAATVPGQWRVVPRSALQGYQTWYKTVVGTPDPAQESQGTIFLNGAGTDTVTVEIEAVFELKAPCNTAVTPAERARREVARERERLLAILGSSTLIPKSK